MTTRSEIEAAERERECISRSQIYRLSPSVEQRPSETEIQKIISACRADPSQDPLAQAALTRAQGQQAVTSAQVRAVTVPTLGIVGSLDREYLPDFMELKRLRPDLTLVIVDGATHGGERAAGRRPEFVASLRSFISAKH